MRTTLDIPDHLLRAAKTRAAEHGERLKDVFARAIAREVGLPTERRETGRVVLPLVGRDEEPRAAVTNADVEAVLAADDAERYGGR